MVAQARPPQREQGAAPQEWKFFDLQEFGSLNTQSPRQSIGDDEFSWVENFFPIAPGNLRTMYGKGNARYTAPNGKTIVYHYFYVLNGVPYAFICLSDGTADQLNLNTNAITSISATPGKFYNGGTFPACCQWGAKYLQIVTDVTTSGYFLWDGAALFGPGSVGPAVTVTSGGTGYTSAPTVTFFGGSGSGATATSAVTNGSVTGVTVTNAGSGYLSTDGLVQIQFSGGGITAKTAIITATVVAGVVTALNIVDGGAGYVSIPTVTFTGGGGSGAVATAVLTGGVITSFSGLTGGTGYATAPAVTISGGSNPSATATVSLMPFGVAGTSIENFQTRVWIENGPKVTFGAPGDPSNFATSSGGGTFTSTDGFLKTSFKALKQSNSYLYLMADSSINNISNLQTSGSPATTTFSNLNSDAQVGTPWRDSVTPYGLALTLGNSSGFYLMYGGAAQKISEKLDGLFSTALLPSSGNGIPAAVGTVFGIKIVMFLMTVIDPFTGDLAPKLICYEAERKKWFIASQEVDLTYISTQEVNSVLTAWGTDGTTLFPLFDQPSTTLVKKGMTKLWNGDSYLWSKQFLRLYSQSFDQSSQGAVITYQVDTDVSSSAAVTISGGGSITFVNALGETLQFVNNSNDDLNFTSTGNSITRANIDSCYGMLMGLQFTSTSPDFIIAAMGIAYQNYYFLQ